MAIDIQGLALPQHEQGQLEHIDLTQKGKMGVINDCVADIPLQQLRSAFAEGDLVCFRFSQQYIEWNGPVNKCAGLLVHYEVRMPSRTVTLTHPDHPEHESYEAELRHEYGDETDWINVEHDSQLCSCEPGHRGLSILCVGCPHDRLE